MGFFVQVEERFIPEGLQAQRRTQRRMDKVLQVSEGLRRTKRRTNDLNVLNDPDQRGHSECAQNVPTITKIKASQHFCSLSMTFFIVIRQMLFCLLCILYNKKQTLQGVDAKRKI